MPLVPRFCWVFLKGGARRQAAAHHASMASKQGPLPPGCHPAPFSPYLEPAPSSTAHSRGCKLFG